LSHKKLFAFAEILKIDDGHKYGLRLDFEKAVSSENQTVFHTFVEDSRSFDGSKMKVEVIFEKQNKVFELKVRIPDSDNSYNELSDQNELSAEACMDEFKLSMDELDTNLSNLEAQQSQYFECVDRVLDGVVDLNSLLHEYTNVDPALMELIRLDEFTLQSPIFGEIYNPKKVYPFDLNGSFKQSPIAHMLLVIIGFENKLNSIAQGLGIGRLHVAKLIEKDRNTDERHSNLVERVKKIRLKFIRSVFLKLKEVIESLSDDEKDEFNKILNLFSILPAEFMNGSKKFFTEFDILALPNQAYSIDIFKLLVEYKKFLKNNSELTDKLKAKVEKVREEFKSSDIDQKSAKFIDLIASRIRLFEHSPAQNPWSPACMPSVLSSRILSSPFSFLLQENIDISKVMEAVNNFIAEGVAISRKYDFPKENKYGHPHFLPRFKPKELVEFVVSLFPENNFFKPIYENVIQKGNFSDRPPKFGVSNFYSSQNKYLYLMLYKPLRVGKFLLANSFAQSFAMVAHEIMHLIENNVGEFSKCAYPMNEYLSVMAQYAILNEIKKKIEESDTLKPEFKEIAIQEINERIEKREIYEYYNFFGVIGCFEVLVYEKIKAHLKKNNNNIDYDKIKSEMLQSYNQTIGEFLLKTEKISKPNTIEQAMDNLSAFIENIAFNHFYTWSYVIGGFDSKIDIEQISMEYLFSKLESLVKNTFELCHLEDLSDISDHLPPRKPLYERIIHEIPLQGLQI
jgi:hypothetical protein